MYKRENKDAVELIHGSKNWPAMPPAAVRKSEAWKKKNMCVGIMYMNAVTFFVKLFCDFTVLAHRAATTF